MKFTIEQDDPRPEPFANCRYRIYEDGHLIAYYWHDVRGDEHGIEFLKGASESWPVGRMIDFLEGGGPKPLTLSAAAVAYLERMRRPV